MTRFEGAQVPPRFRRRRSRAGHRRGVIMGAGHAGACAACASVIVLERQLEETRPKTGWAVPEAAGDHERPDDRRTPAGGG